MQSFLVETKQEYTTQLINILTPLIYEGLKSIYTEALEISTGDNILKNFQICMQRIPKWNNDMINNETQRIMTSTKSYSWLEDLIKATLKANIIVLTYNPSVRQQTSVDPKIYQNIKINDFIHKIYIECARELWNNPYLFFHSYPPIELKRNLRDTILLIKDCIKEALRKLLPLNHILKIYLGEEMITGDTNDQFDKSISEIEGQNLNKLIKKDLYNNQFMSEQIIPNDSNETKQYILPKRSDNMSDIPNMSVNNIRNASDNNIPNMSDDSNVTVGSKILGIINNKDIKLSDDNTSSDYMNSAKRPMSNSDLTNGNQNSQQMNNILNGLDDSDTSVSRQNNNNFQEVFSNSISKNDSSKPMQGGQNNKAKFFANYLQI